MFRKRTYAELLHLTKLFHDQHNRDRTVPVPIEEVLDTKLRFRIVPLVGLLPNAGMYGGLSCGERSIFVDHGLAHSPASESAAQYRLTLAHEFAHFVLHPELYHGALVDRIRSIEDYKRHYMNIPKEVYEAAERQANELAALLLVPREALLEHFDATIHLFGFDQLGRTLNKPERQRVVHAMQFHFEVPQHIIEHRLDRDRLWE